jgi:hypothetical protein
MRRFPLALAAAMAVSASAACRAERRCNERTVLLTVTLIGGAQEADVIEVRPSIEGQGLTGGQVARRPGEVRGTIEVVLGDRYLADALVTLVVLARAGGAVLAEGQVTERLAARCSTLSITLGGVGATDAVSASGAPEPGPAPADGSMDGRSGPDAAPADPPPPADGPSAVEAPIDVASDLAAEAPPGPKRIFVTRGRYTGNLGGLAGAHELCSQLATAAGLTGSYMAWLSTAASGPAAFMTPHPGPYVLPTGEMVAASWADLVDGSILRPIDRDQNGDGADPQRICEGGEVWTNTTAAGTPLGATDCGGWTSQALELSLASSAGNLRYTDARWTNSGCRAIGCSFALQIYCLEQ